MNLLAILGVGATLWQIMKPKDPVDHLVSAAMPIAQQHIDNGVPVQQAIQIASHQVVEDAAAKAVRVGTAAKSPILPLTQDQIKAVTYWGK